MGNALSPEEIAMVTFSSPHLDEWSDESELPTPDYQLHRDCMPVSSHTAARRGSQRSKAKRRPNHGRTGPNGMFRRRRHRC